ncbi:MAG: glycine cleavage system protein GcvH [Planctomycetes bacterium]|nr:glycine cleavage system protein GcvH [Planctomycetota bacterium]
MAVAKDCKYTQTHEWFRTSGNVVTMGITKFAADELTDITYVSLPEVGRKLSAGSSFGEVESVKATSDVYSAVSGEVIETNPKLADHPELVNNDPQGEGWMIRVRCADLAPLEKLMDAAAYEKMLAG